MSRRVATVVCGAWFVVVTPLFASAEPVPAAGGERFGLLEAEGQPTLGWLVNLSGGAGLGWQPSAGGAPVPLGSAARIRFRGMDALGGIGVGVARDGEKWIIVDIEPDGPAARDGRLGVGDGIDWIEPGAGGQRIDTAGLSADEMRSLLRGIAGSAVLVGVSSRGSAERQVRLVRDAAGRGDLAGATPRDVLDRVLSVHEAKQPRREPATGTATLHLRWGDSLAGFVVSADAEGVLVRTTPDVEFAVPAAAVRAVELQAASGRPILEKKRVRLLTLPRMQQADPPTHVVRLTTGDYVRGRLIGLDEATVHMDVQGKTKEFPRGDVARIIWLGRSGETRPSARATLDGQAGTPLQIVGVDGKRLTVTADRVDEGRIVGRSPALGEVRVPVSRCEMILVGDAIDAHRPADLPYEKWVLTPAPLPKALAEESQRR